MGRGFIVEGAVERYLCSLSGAAVERTVTGLVIGQSSAQRDFIIMATRTPEREESAAGSCVDKEWVSEHARQVSRMLPGGLRVLGVFIISQSDGKDTQTTSNLRQLLFAVQNLISTERLWSPEEDDVTDCVTLHINPQTRRTVCRTFDVKDPKSSAKPAEWKYQSGVCSSWSTLSCCVNVDLVLPLPDTKVTTEDREGCVKEGLKLWAQQILSAVFLIDSRKMEDESELTPGQKRNVRQTFRTQLLVSATERRSIDVIQCSGGGVTLRGSVHSRAYLHGNKAKVKEAEKLLKRDVISTVASRAQMLLEELLMSEGAEQEGSGRSHHQLTNHLALPRRVFCPLPSLAPLCVCDYVFADESVYALRERLKEMLDVDVTEDELDAGQEVDAEVSSLTPEATEATMENAKVPDPKVPEPKRNNFSGAAAAAAAAAAAVLAAAASMLYISEV